MDRLQNRHQVERYLAEIFPGRQFRIHRARHGWVCRPTLPSEQGIGLGSYVVDSRTGVVTEHPSLPPAVIGQMFDQAIETGQPIRARQIHPTRWQATMRRIREDRNEIEYLVRAESTDDPTLEHRLTIDKQTLRSRTDAPAIHQVCARAKAWATAHRSPDGAWPEQGTFEL